MAHDVPAVRSIAAIGAGFFAVMMLSLGGDLALNRLSPDAFDAAGRAQSDGVLFIKLAYETLFALVAGYITARIAIRTPYRHAAIMGAIVLASRAFVVVVSWAILPAWFHIGALVLIIPAALLGARLCELRARSMQ